jgi:hypothetical protein
VHFDGGTAGVLDQSSVHCLADGEVVAYRFDQHAPITGYQINKLRVDRPFSRNFVLVRHRLQPPKIKGSPDTPPSLTLYSLYMHLQDWAVYQQDPAMARPVFWPEATTRRVKETVNDIRPGQFDQRGLNVRNHVHQGNVLTLLPPGAEVTISGDGPYRKLENTLGPDFLISAEGALLGYLAHRFLEPISANQHRIKSHEPLDVYAEADVRSAVIAKLPPGTEVTVSGDRQLRKLERVNQYVHYNSLDGAPEPTADRIVMLDQPVPIKAGDLIGHIGLYQNCDADRPESKLHLEVFSGEDANAFLKSSRAWAERMPARDKTWLKLAKGTPIVTHEDGFHTTQIPHLSDAKLLSDADLLLPKSLLDDLPAKSKIALPASPGRRAQNWYRLDGLLNDADNTLLDGWACEEVGTTPWVNPWAWDGYEVIYDYSSPREKLASFYRAMDRFSGAELERFGPTADAGDKGPVQRRLFDIIDRNRDGKMTAEELQTALTVPAHAQSIAQLIVLKESEWFHHPYKWDLLDELLGHNGSTPHLNWVAEKERIKHLSWWNEVMEKVGLPADGKVYHFHPVGIGGNFSAAIDDNDLSWLKVPFGQLTFDVEGNDVEDPDDPLYQYFSRVVHWPGGASGVTIGRGYDLGQRPNIQADLSRAGIEEPMRSWLSGAKGLSGRAALDYLNAASSDIRTHTITRKQQYDLFIPLYEHMKAQVIRISNGQFNKNEYGQLHWTALHRRIQDIVVDLIYRGDYTPASRSHIQKPIVENNIPAIKEILSDSARWPGVPPDRFNRRKAYLN